MKVLFFLFLFTVASVISQDEKYTDWMGRHRWYPVADIIDTDHPENCLKGCFESFEFRRRLVVPCDMWAEEGNQTHSQNATCAASTLVADDDKAIYLSFRGTRSSAQMDEENQNMLTMNILRDAGTRLNKNTIQVAFNCNFLTFYNALERIRSESFENVYKNIGNSINVNLFPN
ncbi:hypothetical protein FO519_006334 [Halicephalobus sp. NKZ332]|nr:hypothetical protein FO519_006334 [Halicephalobus sp. NKZ332]